MTVEHTIYTLNQWLSWLYYRRWEKSELLAIGAVATLALVTVLIRAHRKTRADTERYRARSPIIGLRLGEQGRSHY